MWLTPTEEELFKKYNPELQKRSLERRDQTQAEFDAYVNKLKEYSRSNKPSTSRTPLSISDEELTSASLVGMGRRAGEEERPGEDRAAAQDGGDEAATGGDAAGGRYRQQMMGRLVRNRGD
jgi:hypothetical protein